jgi:2-polyprenyl-3-methyl-5-hydroxy-6-metoxy-1,4-benzoquinol methylase
LTFLKKILSYLVDIQIDTASTGLNPVLQLSLRKGRYYLTTTNAVYSFGDLYDNFSKTFQKLDFEKNKFQNLLVLGFAMGSVPFMLERVFGQKMHCTGVEADTKIVEWASKYTLPTLANPIQLIHEDALVFVEKCSQQFDIIVVDLFLDDLVPTQFESLDFLQKTKSLLTPKGLLLFNRLADTEIALSATQFYLEKTFKIVFPEGNYLDVNGNWMLANRAVWV